MLNDGMPRNNDSKDPITGEILSEDDLVAVKTCKYHHVPLLFAISSIAILYVSHTR